MKVQFYTLVSLICILIITIVLLGIFYKKPIETKIVDGCEYIHIDRSWTHKGNCKNHNP